MPRFRFHLRRADAFTLMELLAVLVIILIIAAISLAVTQYVQERAKISQTRAQLAKLDLAITAFQLDHGYYPTTMIYRVSPVDYHAEKQNGALLYAQLTSPKMYATFNASEISSAFGGTYFIDAWGTPINYFRPISNVSFSVSCTTNNYGVGYVPTTNFYINTLDNFTVGGKENLYYDLFSYGPDQKTYVAGPIRIKIVNSWYGWPVGWASNNAASGKAELALDDVHIQQR